MRHRSVIAFTTVALVAALVTVGGAQVYIKSDHEEFPKVLYADTTISLNDRCIVAQERLNRRVRPVYVNGAPIGFC